MKLIHSFQAFLTDTVNLNKARVDRAHDTFDTLTSFLTNAEATSDFFVDTSKQGSLRQGTIIRPRLEETEFDVDLVFEMADVEGWSPVDYLDTIETAFRSSNLYKDKVRTEDQNRCVTIQYAGDFHVDVVPMIEREDGCYICNKKTNEFEITDGDGYATWFAEGGDIAGGTTLVRVVRLLKYLRDEHDWDIKSILLTTLVGLHVFDQDSADDYPDVPTALLLLMERVDEYLQEQIDVPEVSNPALPQETLTRHWNASTFEAFREDFHRITSLVRSAYDEQTADTSLDKWREAFGDDFPLADEDVEKSVALAQASFALGSTAHAQPVKEIPVSAVDLKYKVRLDGWLYDLAGTKRFRGINSNARMASDRAIKFKAWTNAPEPYEVRWQVVNTGAHATKEGQLRGGFFQGRNLQSKPTPKLVNWETTKFTGQHWIECFILKDGVCVGRSGRFVVNVKNPAF